MANKACSDTGPILHLNEINQLTLFKLFSRIYFTAYIKEELLKYHIKKIPGNFEIKDIDKDQVALLSEKYDLDISESSIIWLCKNLKVPLFLTDDLDARSAGEELELRPVGTIGIILRGYREKLIDKKKTMQLLEDIHKNSTLFITADLIKYVIKEIEGFKK